MTASRITLVTGANRGLGFEVCRQLARQGDTVVLTSRDPEKGESMAHRLQVEKLPVVFHPLDVSVEASIAAAYQFVITRYGRLDVLINNAGVYLDADRSVMTLNLDVLRLTLETNAFGALRMCQVFIPLMKKHAYGRVVNVSSTMGQHVRMQNMSAAYRLSKDALNALTQMIASAVHTDDVLVNCCHPGWVRTDMGGPHATLSIEQGADTIVWLANLPRGGPSGGFFENRERIDW
jgi:NAD(P)-dependent dehydrogenase (short-subunit alcohol dehydrogenase family)